MSNKKSIPRKLQTKQPLLKDQESETQREARIKQSSNKWRDRFGSVDQIMKFVFIIYLGLVVVLAKNALAIEGYFLQRGAVPTDFTEFFFIIPGMIISFTIFKLVKWASKDFILRNLVEHSRIKETPDERLNRVQSFFNTIVYYTLAVTINYSIIMTYTPSYMPRFLGGNLKIDNFLAIWGEVPARPVRIFFVLSIGHHFERTYQHIRHNLKGNNFWIMILHHVITINLMFCAFLNRHLIYGISILFLHDIGDILVGWVKVVREIRHWKHLVIPVFLVLFVVWVYTRNFIFGYEILYPTITQLSLSAPTNYLQNQIFGIGGLLILFFMNVYWAFGMANSAYQKVFKKSGDALHFEGETVDIDAEKKMN